jgi:hypothetical protein
LKQSTLSLALIIVAGMASPVSACIVDEGSGQLRMATEADQSLALPQSLIYRTFSIDWDMLVIGGYQYAPFGLARTIAPSELTLASWYESVPFFRAAGETAILPDVFYFLADAMTCQFQPYQIGAKAP